jgi:TonB C terminal
MSREDTKTRPVIASCAGGLLSLALHLLLMTPVLMGLGTNSKRSRVPSSEIGRPADDYSPSSSMTVLFIDALDADAHAESAQTQDRLAAKPTLDSISVPVPEPIYNLSAIEDVIAPTDTSLGGSSQSDPGRRLLIGRYIAQITARVERAWMRPRTTIDDADFFACRARVTQDRSGVVHEIELVRCNGTLQWQASVVQAIQSASPLPAPPDADVYSAEVILDLQSAAFIPGGSVEGFEPDVRQ